MLAMLLTVPQNQREWGIWSLHNRQELGNIRSAIQQQKKVNLPEYPLDPIPFNAIPQWLAWNEQAHLDFNQVLGLQGSDLESVSFTNPAQLTAWIYLNYQEVYAAEQALNL